jgi:hypothetical protein
MDTRPVSLQELLGFTLVAALLFLVSSWLFGCIQIDPLEVAFSPPIPTIEVTGD